jgi:prephenate dehydratase
MNVAPQSRIAFQGEHGAFSEEAALKLLGPEILLTPRGSFDSAFSAIRVGEADYVLAPMENSLAGSVHRSFDLLVETGLHVIGEVVIPIVHNLIAVPAAKFEQLVWVESHPVALAQCEQFFVAYPDLKRVVTEDTAGSVREIMRAGNPARAAIASARAAEFYGAAILRRHLEDDPENYTRFFLLSSQSDAPADADKISLVFQLPHSPGALQQALAPFAQRNINLMKIESRPVRGKPWQYLFYIDLQAPARSPEIAAALDELAKFAVELKILGSYKSAERVAVATENENHENKKKFRSAEGA